MNLVPKPNEVCEVYEDAYFMPKENVVIDFGTFGETCAEAFLCRARLQNGGGGATSSADIALRQDSCYGSEEYELSVSETGAAITAATENAVIYALTSLYQMQSENGEIPFCRIHDKPRYAHRGLSLDCARHFFPVSEVKRVIEQMSLVKMNVLHWHLTDDQGWRIETERLPELHRQHGGEFYTRGEIRDVVAYAARRGIEIIPEVDMPGHVCALLAVYPQCSCSGKAVNRAEHGGIYPVILCAGSESVYKLIADLLDEICPLFPSARFHIGGDEAPKKEWKKCPRCQEKIAEEGLADEIELQGYFSNRVIEMLRQRGKSAICWNDSLEEANLDKNAVIQFWSVNYAEHLEAFVKNGGRFVYSDMFTYYLDYPHSMTSLKRLYEDAAVVMDADYSSHPSLMGVEACVWAEHLTDSDALAKKLFPRLYAVAEKAWSDECNYADFEKRLNIFVSKFHPVGMCCVPQEIWNPQGEERRSEAFAYMAAMMDTMPPDVRAETMEHAAPKELFGKRFAECFFTPEDLPLLMQAQAKAQA